MKNYENAYKGVSKVFSSEILDIISTVCIFIAAIVGVIALAGAAAGSAGLLAGGGIAAMVLMIGGFVLTIIAYIFKIIGCAKAGKDNQSFHNAFILSIVGIIFSVAYAIVYAIITTLGYSNSIADDIVKIILDVVNMLVIICMINGCGELAAEKGNTEVANKTQTLLYVIIILLLIALISNFVSSAFLSTTASQVIVAILSIIYLVGDVVAYILFLILLAKTKKMLAE